MTKMRWVSLSKLTGSSMRAPMASETAPPTPVASHSRRRRARPAAAAGPAARGRGGPSLRFVVRGAARWVRGCRGRLPVAGGLRSMARELLVRGFRQLVALCFGAVLIALLSSVPTAVSSGRRVSRHMILIQPHQSLGGVPTTGIAPAVA